MWKRNEPDVVLERLIFQETSEFEKPRDTGSVVIRSGGTNNSVIVSAKDDARLIRLASFLLHDQVANRHAFAIVWL